MTLPDTHEPKLPPHRKVRVDLDSRAYDVFIGRGLLFQTGALIRQLGLAAPAVIMTDRQVADHYGSRVTHILDHSALAPFLLALPPGESTKSLAELGNLLSALAQKKVPRSGTIVALGGGVMGDLAGFVAASYLRGISFVQIPTTLLAMVDSSVGGKTGINLPEGKNLVGAFHQPKLVVVDLEVLKTLPAREFAAGMAEVIKYGAIADRALFDRVAAGVRPDADDLDEIIGKCVTIKARIVEQDEFELKGLRALLNFGHTLGHAIEKATRYTHYLHGEAIALGMRAAAWLSHWEGSLPEAEVRAIEKALAANNLPTHLDEPDDSAALLLKDAILQALGNDKKVAGDGGNRWVLLDHLGQAKSGIEIDSAEVEAALNLLLTPIAIK